MQQPWNHIQSTHGLTTNGIRAVDSRMRSDGFYIDEDRRQLLCECLGKMIEAIDRCQANLSARIDRMFEVVKDEIVKKEELESEPEPPMGLSEEIEQYPYSIPQEFTSDCEAKPELLSEQLELSNETKMKEEATKISERELFDEMLNPEELENLNAYKAKIEQPLGIGVLINFTGVNYEVGQDFANFQVQSHKLMGPLARIHWKKSNQKEIPYSRYIAADLHKRGFNVIKMFDPGIEGERVSNIDKEGPSMPATNLNGENIKGEFEENIFEAYRLAVKADSISAFGGIVSFNVGVDEALGRDIREFRKPIGGETYMFYEIVVAPKYSEKGLELLYGKSKTLGILEASKNIGRKLSLIQIGGGWLALEADDLTLEDIKFNIVSERAAPTDEFSDAHYVWLCVKHVKNNAIVIAKNTCMLAMGSGQPNQVESLSIAMRKAGEKVKGAALIWALTNVAYGAFEHTCVDIDQGAVPKFVELGSSASDDVCKLAVWIFGNVAGDTPSCRDFVIGNGSRMLLVAPLIDKALNVEKCYLDTFKFLSRGSQPLHQLIYVNDEESSKGLILGDKDHLNGGQLLWTELIILNRIYLNIL